MCIISSWKMARLQLITTASALVALYAVSSEQRGHSAISWGPSEFGVNLTKIYLKNRRNEFANCTTDEHYRGVIRDLLAWEPPRFIRDNYPYSLTGYTDDNNPVWLFYTGKYDAVKLIQEGEEMVAAAEKMMLRGLYMALSSMEHGRMGNEIPRLVAIIDFEGFQLSHIDSLPAIDWLSKVGIQTRFLVDLLLEEAYIINANFAVENLIHLFKPIAGRIFERVEIYGTIKAKWLPILTRKFPPEALPPEYGGSPSHKPIPSP